MCYLPGSACSLSFLGLINEKTNKQTNMTHTRKRKLLQCLFEEKSYICEHAHIDAYRNGEAKTKGKKKEKRQDMSSITHTQTIEQILFFFSSASNQ